MRKIMILWFAAVFLALASARASDESGIAGQSAAAEPVFSVRRIWDAARHNAFTDLAFFNGQWYCAFREGLHHVCDEGKLRVIRSPDGEQWESVALMGWTPGMQVFFNTPESPDEWTPEALEAGGDVRDAKLSITPDNKLMLTGAVRFFEPVDGNRHQSVTWLSKDGETWDGPYACASGLGTWRWSATWHKGTGYSFGYSGKDDKGRLYKTRDGKAWQALTQEVYPGGRGNETSIVFGSDDTAYCLLRDGPGNVANLGAASPPYENWTWNKLAMNVGGPKIILMPDGRFMAGGRLSCPYTMKPDGKPVRMSLCLVDPDKPDIKEILRLPSGGDCSYPGIVARDDMLWVSYYSSHEGKTSIYLARLPLRPTGGSVAGAFKILAGKRDLQALVAAIEWFGMGGGESVLPVLAEAAGSIDEFDRTTARNAMSRLSGEEIEQAMLAIAGDEAEAAEVRAGVIMALAARGGSLAGNAFDLAEQMLLDARMFGDSGSLAYVEEAYVESAAALGKVDPERAKTALEYFVETSKNGELINRAARAVQ